MAMHDIREYEKKYAVVVFCALHVSRISYGVLKKKYHMLFFPHLYIILYMYVYIPYCGMQKKPQHLFENQSPVEVSLPVYFSLAQNLIKLTLLLILVCLMM